MKLSLRHDGAHLQIFHSQLLIVACFLILLVLAFACTTTIGRTVGAAILFHPPVSNSPKSSISILSRWKRVHSDGHWIGTHGLKMGSAVQSDRHWTQPVPSTWGVYLSQVATKTLRCCHSLSDEQSEVETSYLVNFPTKYVPFLFYLKYLCCWVNSHWLCSTQHALQSFHRVEGLPSHEQLAEVLKLTSWSWACAG